MNDLEMALVQPIISDITSVFTFHIRCISVVSPLCLKIISASFLITFVCPEIAMPTVRHVTFYLSRSLMSGLLLGMVVVVVVV